MKTQTNPKVGDRGFSLVQLLTVVAIGGILASFSFSVYSNLPAAAAEEALRGDVRTINKAIQIYKAFGGDLEGVTSPGAVLAKLQTKADAVSASQTAGLTGTMLDRRLRPIMLPEREEDSGVLRAVWDVNEQRFAVATGGENGVERFDLDESLAGQEIAEEARHQDLKLSAANGWIWQYGDNSASMEAGPTQVLSVYAIGAGVGSGEGPGGEEGASGGGESESGDSASPLDPPVFSVPSGSFVITDYNLALNFTNPNEVGASRVVYQVNSGPWSVYYGDPVMVTPGATVAAYAQSVLPDAWTDSANAIESYSVINVQLEDPVIVADDTGFSEIMNPNNGHGNNEDGVDVSNPGQGGGGPNGEEDPSGTVDDEIKKAGKVKYKVNGSSWKNYEGPFQLAGSENHIVAEVVATELYYEDSDQVSLSVEANNDDD